jgi:hypothetical protein
LRPELAMPDDAHTKESEVTLLADDELVGKPTPGN